MIHPVSHPSHSFCVAHRLPACLSAMMFSLCRADDDTGLPATVWHQSFDNSGGSGDGGNAGKLRGKEKRLSGI